MSNNITKHIGLNNGKKIIICWSQLPEEKHMCLALMTDTIPAAYKEAVFNTVNSEAGQKAKNLADALFEVKLPDGRNLLNVLHTENLLKKLQTDQTFVTPDSVNKIKLNELNDMLEKIEAGGEAAKKLADLDEHKGMNRKKRPNAPADQVSTQSDLNSSDKKLVEELKNTVEALIIEVRNLKGGNLTLQQPVVLTEKKKAGRPTKVKEK